MCAVRTCKSPYKRRWKYTYIENWNILDIISEASWCVNKGNRPKEAAKKHKWLCIHAHTEKNTRFLHKCLFGTSMVHVVLEGRVRPRNWVTTVSCATLCLAWSTLLGRDISHLTLKSLMPAARNTKILPLKRRKFSLLKVTLIERWKTFVFFCMQIPALLTLLTYALCIVARLWNDLRGTLLLGEWNWELKHFILHI